MSHISDQLQETLEAIAQAEQRSGRPAGSVQLLAVSKTFTCQDILTAYEAGQRHFGENRLQEAMEKLPQLPADIHWHLIGPLQRNKVRKALQQGFHLLQAIPSLRLAQTVSRIAEENALRAPLLLEVNVDAEPSKHGFSPAELLMSWDSLQALPSLDIRGLMCIPAFGAEGEDSRAAFRTLRHLAEQLRERAPSLPLPELSMGMSHDFTVAIEEGATMVRVGSAIFGQRDYS